MNIITFDIEEWYIEKILNGGRISRYSQFDTYLDILLNLLDETSTKATFFCVGMMATDFPDVIKKINLRGHEIGCHSNSHTWLNKMSKEEALEDTRIAIDSIEQLIGNKVLSYRAPAFSIGENNRWAFEVLAECGIVRDASIYPAVRDFGGFSSFRHKEPVMITYNGIQIKEFPICTTNIFGKQMAFSGGGYFRFFPLWFVKKEMKKASYSMCYFHIGDILPETSGVMTKLEYEEYFKENGSLFNRYKRYFKSNFGKKHALEKLIKLFYSNSFMNLEQADINISWGNKFINL